MQSWSGVTPCEALFLLWEMHWVAVKNAKFKKLTIWDSDAHPISEKIQNVRKEGNTNICVHACHQSVFYLYLNLNVNLLISPRLKKYGFSIHSSILSETC